MQIYFYKNISLFQKPSYFDISTIVKACTYFLTTEQSSANVRILQHQTLIATEFTAIHSTHRLHTETLLKYGNDNGDREICDTYSCILCFVD